MEIENLKIGVIGLGYVGLPLALAFARKFPGTVGFDLNQAKVSSIQQGKDPTDENLEQELRSTSLRVAHDASILRGCNFIVVGVPTPVDVNNTPDLTPLLRASESVGSVIQGGEVIVFESTVYPGVTEEVCGPIIARTSGLQQGRDFWLGYSPERINPGDQEHRLEKVTKVVSGETPQVLEHVARVYSAVIQAGVHRAPSIKVAEAAKVIENTQRDLNIALMNELAIIFDRMQISTQDVLAAAGTKWNFLRFSPGLVGGHCIGVDPYYLTTKAQQLGYHPQVILAGRRINDGMGAWVAQRSVKLLINAGIQPRGARIGVLGITFKENVSDIRNSRVPDIVRELKEFGVEVLVHEPYGSAHEIHEEYGIEVCRFEDLKNLDGLIIAVAHKAFAEQRPASLLAGLKPHAILVDVKSLLKGASLPSGISYWSL
jgi:UDP-N-acetyl-D-galactosamine dehydrogenase